MRKLGLVLGVLSVMMLASDATAVVPQPPPPPGTLVRIRSFRIKSPDLSGLYPYKGGPLDLALEIENIGTTPTSVTVFLSPSTVGKQTITVPPAGTTGALTTVVFTDAGGVTESCTPHMYSMELEGKAVDPRQRHVNINPTCVWSGTVEDGWAATPAVADEARKSKAFVSSVVVNTGPTCQTPAKLTAVVANHSSKSGVSLDVAAMAGDTAKGKSLAFSLAPVTVKNITLSAAGGASLPEVNIVLEDPTQSLGGEIASHPLHVHYARACKLSVTSLM